MFASQAPWEIKWLAWLAATLIFLQYLSRYILLRSPHAITEIRFDQADLAWLWTRNGQFFNACLAGDSFLSAHFVVLNFRLDKKSCIVAAIHAKDVRKLLPGNNASVVLFPDTVDLATFRRIKVHLLTKKTA